MIKVFEILRWAMVVAGYIIAYVFHNETPADILHYLNPWVIGGIAGFSAIEGLFWADKAAKEKGYEVGSNYQRQNAFWFLVTTVVMLIVTFNNWGVNADMTITLVFIGFLLLSGGNHLYQAIAKGNKTWNNLIRPVGMMLLAGLYAYPLWMLLM